MSYTAALKLINDRKSKKRLLTVLSTGGLSSLSVIMLVIIVVVIIVIVPSISALILPFSYAQQQPPQYAVTNSAACIIYDSDAKIITITCDSTSLTDIDNQIKDANVIHKEETNPTGSGDHRGGIWLLNAGIVVTDTGTLYINSTDTTWLKINVDGIL